MNRPDDSVARHRLTWDLIPGVVNGRVSEEEHRSVDEHLQSCGDCREEYEFQRRLHGVLQADGTVERDPQPALQRLWTRIDALDERARSEPAAPGIGETKLRPQIRTRYLARTLAAAVFVEAIGLAFLGQALWGHAEPAAYRTLTTPTTSTQRPTIRAVLAPTLTVGELHRLLGRLRLQIVDGPTEAGVYSLAPAAAGNAGANVLAELRADPGVRFAEPLDPVSGQPQ